MESPTVPVGRISQWPQGWYLPMSPGGNFSMSPGVESQCPRGEKEGVERGGRASTPSVLPLLPQLFDCDS